MFLRYHRPPRDPSEKLVRFDAPCAATGPQFEGANAQSMMHSPLPDVLSHIYEGRFPTPPQTCSVESTSCASSHKKYHGPHHATPRSPSEKLVPEGMYTYMLHDHFLLVHHLFGQSDLLLFYVSVSCSWEIT